MKWFYVAIPIIIFAGFYIIPKTVKTAETQTTEENKNMATAQAFEKAFNFTVGVEGGYNAKTATNMGVTQGFYNSVYSRYGLQYKSVKYLTKAEVKKIYYYHFWLGAGCNFLPDKMAIALFDSAVNHNVMPARDMLAQSGYNLVKFLKIRLNYYKMLAGMNSTNRSNYTGWVNRFKKLQNYIGVYVV